jgi:hypothetical protein
VLFDAAEKFHQFKRRLAMALLKRRKEKSFVNEKHEFKVERFLQASYDFCPNVMVKSNYFLPLINVNNYNTNEKNEVNFHPLEIINNSNLKISYSGFRGNMHDFKIYYLLLNKAKKNDLKLEISQSELLKSLDVNKENTRFIKTLINSLTKQMATLIKVETNDKINWTIFNIVDSFSMVSKGKHKIFYIYFCDSLHRSLMFEDFSYIDNKIIKQLGRNQYAIKLYSLLAFNQNEFHIKKNNLIEMYKPTIVNQFFIDFQNRAVKPLENLGIVTKYDRGPNHFSFNIQKTNIIMQVKKEVVNKRNLLVEGLKKQEKEHKRNGRRKVVEGTKILPKLKHRRDVLDIIDYWESLDLYKHKNRNTKIFQDGMRHLSSAIEGTLYLKTKYEKYNTIFEPEFIKKAIKTFSIRTYNADVLPLNKTYLIKTTLANFMLPNTFSQTKISIPLFMHCYKYGLEYIEKPLDEGKLKIYKYAYAQQSGKKVSELQPQEEIHLIKSLNQLIKNDFQFKVDGIDDINVLRTLIEAVKETRKIQKITACDLYMKNDKSILASFNIYKSKNGYIHS